MHRGVGKFDIVVSSQLDTDKVDMWETSTLTQTAQYTCCAVASRVSNVVELTGVLHILYTVLSAAGFGRELYSNWLACMHGHVSNSHGEWWSARCSENGEELPGDSDQLCGAHMEGKHGSTGHGALGQTLRSEYQVGLKSRSFGMAQQL